MAKKRIVNQQSTAYGILVMDANSGDYCERILPATVLDRHDPDKSKWRKVEGFLIVEEGEITEQIEAQEQKGNLRIENI